jgi:hypothetical protein
MHLVYLNTGISSVFESQVLGLLFYYKKTFPNYRITLLFGYCNKKEIKATNKLLNGTSIELFFFKSYPNYPIFNWFNRISLVYALKNTIVDSENTVVHIRGELLAWQAYFPLKKNKISLKKVLVDIRGAGLEEIKEFGEVNALLKKFKLLNYYSGLNCLKKYFNISAVSPELKKYISLKITSEKIKLLVIPCLAGESFNYSDYQRQVIRKSLGLTEKDILLVFSSGGSAQWQNNQIISQLTGKGWKILNLSRISIEHPDVINKFVPYNKMPDYLSSADIAIILRGKNIVNNVACPVKFCEFVCSGLPMIANRNVSFICDYIIETKNGAVIENITDINNELITKLLKISRKEISEKGQLRFSINTIASLYIAQYQNMPE